jgi:hypothetical protein
MQTDIHYKGRDVATYGRWTDGRWYYVLHGISVPGPYFLDGQFSASKAEQIVRTVAEALAD